MPCRRSAKSVWVILSKISMRRLFKSESKVRVVPPLPKIWRHIGAPWLRRCVQSNPHHNRRGELRVGFSSSSIAWLHAIFYAHQNWCPQLSVSGLFSVFRMLCHLMKGIITEIVPQRIAALGFATIRVRVSPLSRRRELREGFVLHLLKYDCVV